MQQQPERQLPADVFLDLDREGPIPLYYQIASRLEAEILKGSLPAGARLENEVALGLRLKLSRPTIRRAIQELVDKGLLVRRRGIGTQVVHGRVTRNVELTSLFEDLQANGQNPSTLILSTELGVADAATAQALSVDVGTTVLRLERLRSANGIPLAHLKNVLPAEYADIDLGQLKAHGLYQVLRSRGVTMKVAKQSIGARSVTTREAELLGVQRDGPVLTMHRTVFDNSGRPVEFGAHAYRPDLYSFEVTLVNR